MKFNELKVGDSVRRKDTKRKGTIIEIGYLGIHVSYPFGAPWHEWVNLTNLEYGKVEITWQDIHT